MQELTQLIGTLNTEADTRQLGAALANTLPALAKAGSGPFTVALRGTLGVGKTSLVRALLQSLGVSGAIKSPTYALVEPYDTNGLLFYHFDFYRFKYPEEFLERGFDDYFGAHAVCLIEWPDKAGHCLPKPDLSCTLSIPVPASDPDVEPPRLVQFQAHSAAGLSCLNALSYPPLHPPVGA